MWHTVLSWWAHKDRVFQSFWGRIWNLSSGKCGLSTWTSFCWQRLSLELWSVGKQFLHFVNGYGSHAVNHTFWISVKKSTFLLVWPDSLVFLVQQSCNRSETPPESFFLYNVYRMRLGQSPSRSSPFLLCPKLWLHHPWSPRRWESWGREFHVLSQISMAEVEPGASLFPNGVPWLYALFAMLFVFFLFVMFSPFLLEIDQHIKKCKYHGEP